ncbi:MAG: transposase [Candidatus Melainabacteria bacterium]|nr:transposase [Candidatus Melainabacteria bacterium]
MTRKRHTEEQIIAVLKDAQAGLSVQDLCRKHGISDATLYKWRTKYAGLEVSDVKKLRQLEEENRVWREEGVGGAEADGDDLVHSSQLPC